MTTFLNWVYAQASKVYDWFSSSYYTLRNNAANAWNWAVSQANAALSAARSYAYDIARQVTGGITSSIDWLKNQLTYLRRDVLDDLTGLYDWVEYKIRQIQSLTVDDVLNWIRSEIRFVYDLFNSAIAYINQQKDYIVSQFISSFGWINDLRSFINNLVNTFTNNLLKNIISFFNLDLSFILALIQNPKGIILDIIQKDFISFLCFILAYGLGTTKYDLPKSPTWKDK